MLRRILWPTTRYDSMQQNMKKQMRKNRAGKKSRRMAYHERIPLREFLEILYNCLFLDSREMTICLEKLKSKKMITNLIYNNW